MTQYHGIDVSGDRNATTIMVSIIDAFVQQGARDLISNIEVDLDYRQYEYICAVTTRFRGGESFGTAVRIGVDMLERSLSYRDSADMFYSLVERMIDDIRGRIAGQISAATEIRRTAPSVPRSNRNMFNPDYSTTATMPNIMRMAEADDRYIAQLEQRANRDNIADRFRMPDKHAKPREKAKVAVTRKIRIRKLQSTAKDE